MEDASRFVVRLGINSPLAEKQGTKKSYRRECNFEFTTQLKMDPPKLSHNSPPDLVRHHRSAQGSAAPLSPR